MSNFIIRELTVKELKAAIDKEKKMARSESRYMFLWLGLAVLSVIMARPLLTFTTYLLSFKYLWLSSKKEASRHEDIVRMLCMYLKQEFRVKLMELESQQSNSQNCSQNR